MMNTTPNAYGCYDPQCLDSTWDHECPVVPEPAVALPPSVNDSELCPSCEGTGVCVICRGGSSHNVGQTCQCQATHLCVDCHGQGTYSMYAAEQMARLRSLLTQSGVRFGVMSVLIILPLLVGAIVWLIWDVHRYP